MLGIAYQYDEEQRLGLAVWVGEISLDAWQAHVAQRLADPAVAAPLRSLVDIRRWKLDDSIDEAAIHEMAARWGTTGLVSDGKPAAIVAEAGFWKARTYDDALARYGGHLIVFNDLGIACTWLGIDAVRTGRRIDEMVAELLGAGGVST
ncbi:MAG: hypothetical protein ACHQNA_05365 [Acidimicrobiales bacterium]